MSGNPIEEITDEQAIAEFNAGTRDLDSLTQSQMETAYAQAKSGEVPSEQVIVTAAEETKQEDVKPVEGVSDIKPILSVHEQLRDALNAKNTAEQKLTSRDAKLKRLEEDPNYRNQLYGVEATYEKTPDDKLLSDENLQDIGITKQKLAALEARFEAQGKKLADSETTTKAKTEMDELFSDVDLIQSKFASLKTTTNFRDFDTEYVSLQRDIGADNISKYMTDTAYKQSIDSQRDTAGLNVVDMKKSQKIYDAVAKFRSEKKINTNATFENVFRSTDHYEEAMRAKYSGHEVANDEALNRKMQEIAAEPQILGTTTAGVESTSEQSLAIELDALAQLSVHTPEQAKRLAEIGSILMG